MAIKNLEKMDIYNPTNYVNNSEPDIDADNLNKTENKLEETVAKANEIIDALKTLISTVQANSDNTVPSSSLAYAMQQEITKNKEDIATANSNLINKGIIDPQSAQANINTDWVSSGTVYYRITNGICFVDFDLTLKTITILNTLIVSGLPTAKIMAHSKLQGWEDNTISVPCYVYDNNVLANPGPAGHYVGSFSYAVR